ncbi:hypothetical protein EZJ49_08415 [Bdellovibrio bacteriovorus]|uniref:outer membrane beta-barrel protein n=1 Tax=Bdellovibrio bacteriovorus TaxID=959 RepID=UPI0021D0B4B6|nr:outer membrane beta-barrel protein [Bdellovibrio bacteriovorus]UXR63098.1 hypothetical protein EZJ49_08415 [Bdellovibrio bacteriovorus]
MRFLIATLLISSLVSPAWALKTVVVKNDRALLDLEGEDLQVGDKVGARDADGKARALLEIKQIKNGKAVAAVLKGKMSQEYSVSKIGGTKTSAGAAKASSPKSPRSKSAWGVTAGYAMNSMTVKPSANSSVSLSGSSINASGFYQMNLDGNISARFLGGYETLVAKGTSSNVTCSGTECSVDISYLGVEALVRYSYLRNTKFDAWVGGGLGFLFAIGKSSNVLNTSKISTNQTFVGSLGLDYHLNKKNFIPVQLDYAMYPDNNTSAANQIILRAGWGINF